MRDSMRSFLDAQRKRMRAYKEGVYELSEDEGFRCNECGWQGLSAPMADEEDRDMENGVLLKCPECGTPDIENSQPEIKFYQEFGYEYTDFPRNIPNGKEDQYKRS